MRRLSRRAPFPSRSNSGLALVLVLTVILALAVIATPFVLSMIMHERTAVAERARRQAGYGAEGVRNFAVVRLSRGSDSVERRDLEQGKTEASPYADTPDEFVVEMRDARLKDLEVRDPKGVLWGVTATDEQGKLNVTSAPDRVAANLRTSLVGRVVNLREVLTIYSGRAARWVRPQKIRALGIITPPSKAAAGRIAGIQVDNAVQMGIGVKLRATKPGLPAFETRVTRNGVSSLGLHAVETDPPIPSRYLHGVLEIELRHPVNVNTARRETLSVLFEGLSLYIPSADGPHPTACVLSPDDARAVAEAFHQKRISTWHEFLALALALDLDDLKKAAVIINAVDPGNMLLTAGAEGRGSAGLCFTSNETVSIESLASANNPMGNPQGGAKYSEVVDLGSPEVLTRSWENQFDFDRMTGPPRLVVSATGRLPILPAKVADTLRAAGVLGAAYSGYPFGSRMETFPKDLEKGEPSDMSLKSGQGKDPNYVSMRTERDHRGQGNLLRRVEHFDKELDGRSIVEAPFSRTHKEVFAAMPGRPDVASGGTEFWIRFDRRPTPGAPVKLFDIRETDVTNRISITLQDNQIVYRVTDATLGAAHVALRKGWSEIRAPFIPEKDTWYHIAAYWKGTRYGQMVLMIDGFVPKDATWGYVDADGGAAQSTELSSDLGVPSDAKNPYTGIPVKNGSWLQRPATWPVDKPWTVPLRIGAEVVDYDPATRLGRRGSRSADSVYGPSYDSHPANAKATLFGYTSVLRNLKVELEYPSRNGSISMDFGPIPATRGVVAHPFGKCRLAILVGEQRGKSSGKILGKGAQRIRFQLLSDAHIETDTSEWPESGFIRIEDEAIYYRKIVRVTKKNGYFEQCERGRAGTEDVNHMEGVPIELWAVAVSNPDSSLSNPTIVQFNREWFGPVQLVQVPRGGPADFYWTGCVLDGKALPFGRGGSWFTPFTSHEVGEPLVPVFSARDPDERVVRTNMQAFDPVTVQKASNHRELHEIGNSITVEEFHQWNFMRDGAPAPPRPPADKADRCVQLAALRAPVKEDIPVDGLHNRVMKWPSGESVAERFLAVKNPPVRYGPAPGTLDEVKTVASLTTGDEVNAVADPESPQVRASSLADLRVTTSRPSGLLLIGEELVGFAESRGPDTLLYCERGWLNSPRQVHDRGDAVFPLDFLPVAALKDGALFATDRKSRISQELAGQELTRGYALMDKEIVGFEETGLKGDELDFLARFDGSGLFRGLFGTSAAAHPPHSMIFAIPFRYSAGYKRLEFDNRMPYFQAAHTTRGARWREIRFQAVPDGADSNLRPVCIVRIDGLGDCAIPSEGDHSAVWEFPGSPRHSLQDYVSSRLENGQVEARFFLDYAPGSYWPEHSWKRTMKLHEVRIDYDRDMKVLLHE